MNEPTVLLKLAQVKAKTGMSQTFIYDQIAIGRFPKPVKVGVANRWVEAEVEAWTQARIRERDMGKDMGREQAA